MNAQRRALLAGIAQACGLAAASGVFRPSLAQPANEVVDWPRSQIPAPFELTDLDGRTWRLRDLQGRAVLLNFWATWCPPCRVEMPTLEQLAQFHGPEELCVLAVNFKESAATAARFARNTGLTLPIVLDPVGALARQWGASVFPTTILFAADGTPRQRVRGEVDWSGSQAARLLTPLLRH